MSRTVILIAGALVVTVALATTAVINRPAAITTAAEPAFTIVAGTNYAGNRATNSATSAENKAVKRGELDLSGDRQVYVFGEIGGNSAGIAQQILLLGQDPRPITVLLNSPGGSVFDGAAIISAIQAAKGPVNTVCVGLCASMAAMIHQYGTNRYMIDRSVLMFHPAAGGLQGTIDQMNSRLSLFQSFIGKMEQNVANRAHITLDEYRRKSLVEYWVDAEDSQRNGLSDGTVYVRGENAVKLFGQASVAGNPEERKRVILPPSVPTHIEQFKGLEWK